MKLNYDHKGKIFTDYISKDPVKSIVQTSTNRISGMVYVRQDTRLKDELNDQDYFVAITDATVFDSRGEIEEYRTGFLVIHRDSIIWLIPQDEIESNR